MVEGIESVGGGVNVGDVGTVGKLSRSVVVVVWCRAKPRGVKSGKDKTWEK